MNRLQLLLTKLSEESSEVSQIALKTQQFGLYESCPGQLFTNAERTHQEIDDLMAIIEMLNDEFGFAYTSSRERIEAKKAKVNKFAAYSIELGLVETGNSKPETENEVLSCNEVLS